MPFTQTRVSEPSLVSADRSWALTRRGRRRRRTWRAPQKSSPSLRDPDQIWRVKDRRIHGSRTRILVARCARSSNARASHFSSLAIARSSKCDKISGLLLFGSRKQAPAPAPAPAPASAPAPAPAPQGEGATCFRDPKSKRPESLSHFEERAIASDEKCEARAFEERALASDENASPLMQCSSKSTDSPVFYSETAFWVP